MLALAKMESKREIPVEAGAGVTGAECVAPSVESLANSESSGVFTGAFGADGMNFEKRASISEFEGASDGAPLSLAPVSL